MPSAPKFELVSFDICPYVQRSVITLKHKKVDFKLTFIELDQPPQWFNKISPLGKVPLLLVRTPGNSEPVVLFESAAINEYVDEITPPSLGAGDPLQRARERAWVAVSSELLMGLFTIMMAKDKDEAAEAKQELWETLSHVEAALPGGRFFSSRGFSLVDAAFAPAFMRLLMLKSIRDDEHWKSLPKTFAWAKALLEMPEVRDSVVPDFKTRYVSLLKRRESPMVGEII